MFSSSISIGSIGQTPPKVVPEYWEKGKSVGNENDKYTMIAQQYSGKIIQNRPHVKNKVTNREDDN